MPLVQGSSEDYSREYKEADRGRV